MNEWMNAVCDYNWFFFKLEWSKTKKKEAKWINNFVCFLFFFNCATRQGGEKNTKLAGLLSCVRRTPKKYLIWNKWHLIINFTRIFTIHAQLIWNVTHIFIEICCFFFKVLNKRWFQKIFDLYIFVYIYI